MCHRSNNIRRDPNPPEARKRSDKSEGLTQKEPEGLDRADTYPDLYNLSDTPTAN